MTAGTTSEDMDRRRVVEYVLVAGLVPKKQENTASPPTQNGERVFVHIIIAMTQCLYPDTLELPECSGSKQRLCLLWPNLGPVNHNVCVPLHTSSHTIHWSLYSSYITFILRIHKAVSFTMQYITCTQAFSPILSLNSPVYQVETIALLCFAVWVI